MYVICLQGSCRRVPRKRAQAACESGVCWPAPAACAPLPCCRECPEVPATRSDAADTHPTACLSLHLSPTVPCREASDPEAPEMAATFARHLLVRMHTDPAWNQTWWVWVGGRVGVHGWECRDVCRWVGEGARGGWGCAQRPCCCSAAACAQGLRQQSARLRRATQRAAWLPAWRRGLFWATQPSPDDIFTPEVMTDHHIELLQAPSIVRALCAWQRGQYRGALRHAAPAASAAARACSRRHARPAPPHAGRTATALHPASRLQEKRVRWHRDVTEEVSEVGL